MTTVEVFGKYEIVRKLSRGMTDVYLVRDTWTRQPAVLKKIEHSTDEFTLLAIEAETRGAQIQKQLHQLDPRILEVYEIGEQNDCFFVAMEYFEGRTLAQMLEEERRFEPKRAARYAAEICSQLRVLHSFFSDVNGRKTAVIHGDIKPSNVQIGLKDDLRLLDFGIAKIITSTHHLTRHNMGSPSYCSPERLSKAQVDFHADLWALGVSLYEMLSGTPPYQAEDTRRLENLIQSKRPPRALPGDCPAPLKAIVLKALAGDINSRYQSAEAFENDVRGFLEGQPIIAASAPASWDVNATIDKNDKQVKHSATRATIASRTLVRSLSRVRVRWPEWSNIAVALLAGLLVGLLLFIPLGYLYRARTSVSPLRGPKDYAHEPLQLLNSDWALFQDAKRRHTFLGSFSPVLAVEKPLRANLLAAADNIIDNFRGSLNPRLSDFDWARARLCLQHALEMDSADTKAKGKLALCDGYLNLEQNPKPPKASLSINNFRLASSYLPNSPDPHLGLARVHISAYHNVGEAMAEFQQAQRLGFLLGPREAAEQADGYLFRSEWELFRARQIFSSDKEEALRWLQMARSDLDSARKLYEPLVGFANVTENLEHAHKDRLELNRLEAAAIDPPVPKPAVRKWSKGKRRWR